MARQNPKPSRLSNRPVHEPAATTAFSPQWELERMVSSCLLGEDTFYVDGVSIQERIFELAQQVPAVDVAALAIHARTALGLRHAPLWLLGALANRKEANGPLIRHAASTVLRTPRDAMDLIAMYWYQGWDSENEGKRKPLPHAFKAAVRDGFARWSEFQLRRYGTLLDVNVKLRDIMFMCHPKPYEDRQRWELFQAIANRTVTPPDTWESQLPRCESAGERRTMWEWMLRNHKLGTLAFLRNLRNMLLVGVDPALIVDSLVHLRAADAWPWQVLSAIREAPQLEDALAAFMHRGLRGLPRLPGHTGVLVDVSSSMVAPLSKHGLMGRVDAAAGMAAVVTALVEHVQIASFSNRVVGVAGTGYRLVQAIKNSQPWEGTLLGRAIETFTREHHKLDRLIVVTDEQSQDRVVWPAGVRCYVINVAPYQRGVESSGEVTRINGWSGNIMRYIGEIEGVPIRRLAEEDDDATS